MSTAVYLRISTGQQSVDQQHDVIAAAGITPDRVFTDGRAGSNRPGWTECMGWLREGDHLVVAAVDRLGRSVREVATALHELTNRGVNVRSVRRLPGTGGPDQLPHAASSMRGPVPRTVFNAPLTERRAVAFASIPLAQMKTVRHAFGGSVNNVFLAACTLSLRAWLQRHDAVPDYPLLMQIPLSLWL